MIAVIFEVWPADGRKQPRAAQKRGREGVFRDYRLLIAGVVRDYGLKDRVEAPADSRVTNG